MAQSDDDEVFVYHFYSSRGLWLHCGLTIDPDRREGEHRRAFSEPGGFLEIKDGPMPRWRARTWERDNSCPPFGNGPSSRGNSGTKDRLLLIGAATLGVLALGGVVLLAERHGRVDGER